MNNAISYPEAKMTIDKPLTVIGFESDTDIPVL